jgi:DMSO/TMAO reductase YedYZ molybdopterin-dependent catalytic subunit
MISRRNFIRTTSGALVAASAVPSILSWASDDQLASVPAQDRMIVRSTRFLDLEMPPEFATSWITPVNHFYVRNHMFEPASFDLNDWRINLGGEVTSPAIFTIADLHALPQHEVVNTLECAGNGRSFQRPQVPGIQWGKGTVGNARFRGPRLRDILQKAELKTTGKHVMFHGADTVPGKVPPFTRSIPIEKAMDEDTLLATHMNDEPLSENHGFPVRALVPGWVGAASCKWLTEIKILDKEFEGNFMKPGYRFPNHPGKPGEAINPDDTHPLTSLVVKSLIALPDNATLTGRSHKIQGTAWAGEADIVKVEISTDGGSTWKSAKFGHEKAKYAWRSWSFAWKAPKPGDYTILSRATDSQGHTQPTAAIWNPSGYFYNAYDQVKVHVA